MKKILSCICTLFLLISLAACSTSTKDTPNPNTETTSQIESRLPGNSTDTDSPVSENHVPYDGNYPQHEAYGTGIGAMPGRVVWMHNPTSVEWDGSGYWWKIEHFDENYLHEAGLVEKAPSGTSYTDGNRHTVTNLGVHEHWNNSTEKLYSRNLGKDEGIELIQVGH